MALSRYCVINVFLVCVQFYQVLFPGWMLAGDTIRRMKQRNLVVELWMVENASRVIILTQFLFILYVHVCFVRFGVYCLVHKSTCHVMATLAWRNLAFYWGGKDGTNLPTLFCHLFLKKNGLTIAKKRQTSEQALERANERKNKQTDS